MARREGLVSEDSPTKAVKVLKLKINGSGFYHRKKRPTSGLPEAAEPDHSRHGLSVPVYRYALRGVKSLKWGAVDLDRGLITIFDAKGGKTRTAFMTPEVREMLASREGRET